MSRESDIFNKAISKRLQEHLLRAVIDGCGAAFDAAKKRPDEFFHDAIPAERRLAVEPLLRQLVLPKGLTSELRPTPSTHYTKISGPTVVLTAVTRSFARTWVRPDRYRYTLAREAQMFLRGLEHEDRSAGSDRLYALLMYGGAHKKKLPTLAHIVFPLPSGLLAPGSIDLLVAHSRVVESYQPKDAREAHVNLRAPKKTSDQGDGSMTSLPQFCGERLRDARVARGLTGSSLAEMVGVSPASISQYEHGEAGPRPATVSRMVAELRLPEPYFFKAAREPDPAPYLYRSMTAATKRARDSAEVRQRWCMDIFDTVIPYVTVPHPAISDLGFGDNPTTILPDKIETAATEMRSLMGLGDGPVPNVVASLEAHGCAVSRFSFGAEALSSFSQFAGTQPTVALNADYDVAVRGRFNAAHELGHLVLHRKVSRRTAEDLATHKLMETQAHRFAASFLFPAPAFSEEIYSTAIDALVPAKRRWMVSIQMMLLRARDLELVTQDRYERAMREVSRRGFRTREPLDDELPSERPTVLSKAIKLVIDSGTMSRGELLHRLPFLPNEVEVLAQLPQGYLQSPQWGEVVSLKTAAARPTAPAPAEHTATIIPFKR